jgi:hypothetical protein
LIAKATDFSRSLAAAERSGRQQAVRGSETDGTNRHCKEVAVLLPTR